jgi:hypothetical protein
LRVGRVRRELLAHSIVAGLHTSGLRNLRLAVGEVMQDAKLAYELIGCRVGHCFSPDDFGFICFGILGVCARPGRNESSASANRLVVLKF